MTKTKKSKAAFFPFYPADFHMNTMDLSDELVGIYLRLLIRQWFRGPIKIVPGELLEFFTKTEEGYVNDRLELERQKQNDIWDQRMKASLIAKDKRDTGRTTERTTERTTTWDTGKGSKPKPKPKPNTKPKPKPLKEEGALLTLPWSSDRFNAVWATWKEYKKKEHNFHYKSDISEKAALMKLSNLAKGEEEMAYLIIFNAIAGSWKGFFALKNDDLKQLKLQANDDGLDEIRRKYDL